jgi:hypothetical protein
MLYKKLWENKIMTRKKLMVAMMRMGGELKEMEWVRIKKKMLMYQKKKRRMQQRRRVRKGSPTKRDVHIGRRGKDNCMSIQSN